MTVVVCGAGAIGASLAFFLSRRGAEVIVVERTGVANAASGKSGGFLALDWCDGGPLQHLARRSFALHAELAEELGNDWGYRRLDTYAGHFSAGDTRPGRHAARLGWLAASVTADRQLGSPETTAQVHPALYTRAMMRAAEMNGARLVSGTVEGIERDAGALRAVIVNGSPLAADATVIALGPWSMLAAEWLPLPAVYGLKGHSIVFDTGTKASADALFLEYVDEDGQHLTPEVFPRADGTTYVCGVSSESALPIDPGDVTPDPGALDRLESLCRQLSPVLRDSPVLTRQACYRPIARDGLPLIGAIAGVEGAYVATGHSVWGILNAPATGEALAELILDGAARSVDLGGLPNRTSALANKPISRLGCLSAKASSASRE